VFNAGDDEGYFTNINLRVLARKKFRLNNIELSTAITVHDSFVQLKSDANIKDIPPKSFGIVIGDKVSGRKRELTVRFLDNVERQVSSKEAYLLDNIV
jgi:hypothetical protein